MPEVTQNCPKCGKILWGEDRLIGCACGGVHDKLVHSPGGHTWRSLYEPCCNEKLALELAADEVLYDTPGRRVPDATLMLMRARGHKRAVRLIETIRRMRGDG